MSAIATSNNDTVFIAWSVDEKIPDCIGFTVHRIEGNTETPLPAYVGFEGDANPEWKPKTTDDWPVQKFSWKDLYAKVGGVYSYKIIPLGGPSAKPTPLPGVATLVTKPVSVGPDRDGAKVYFNRGMLSTQATTRDLTAGGAELATNTVMRRIAQDGDSVRTRLAGALPSTFGAFLGRGKANGGGEYYAALYELTDQVLIAGLLGLEKLHIVLSNAQQEGQPYDGENAAARQALKDAGFEVVSRFMSSGHIGHDKFVVYVDANGKPQAVLTGSTNWTPTGLCTQANNVIVIDSPDLAAQYLGFWNRLKDDTSAAIKAKGDVQPNSALQGPQLRTDDQGPNKMLKLGKGNVQAWFSPNTDVKSKPTPKDGKEIPTPVDMRDVFDVLRKAEQGVIFLAFQPGDPGILSELQKVIAARQEGGQRPLFIRGAVNDPNAAQDFNTTVLFHQSLDVAASVVSIAGIPEQFAYWQKELFRVGHATIHDKIIVVDPLDEKKCVVITGSHNLGYRASYNNDENMLIIRGNSSIAQAYATHVMDIYDHYRWRWYQGKAAPNATVADLPAASAPPSWSGLFKESDAWQDKYFEKGHLSRLERLFWAGKLDEA